MCEALGYRVLDLHRESVMGIDLRGLQGEGYWSTLNEEEQGWVEEAVRQAEARIKRMETGEEEEQEGEE